jgi:hypothetical protein
MPPCKMRGCQDVALPKDTIEGPRHASEQPVAARLPPRPRGARPPLLHESGAHAQPALDKVPLRPRRQDRAGKQRRQQPRQLDDVLEAPPHGRLAGAEGRQRRGRGDLEGREALIEAWWRGGRACEWGPGRRANGGRAGGRSEGWEAG